MACATGYVSQEGAMSALDPDACAMCRETYESLSAQELRVLAVAISDVPTRPAYSIAGERDLSSSASWRSPIRPLRTRNTPSRRSGETAST